MDPNLKRLAPPGLLTGHHLLSVMSYCHDHQMALPTFSCFSSSSINAVLEAGQSCGSPIIIQLDCEDAAFMVGGVNPEINLRSIILGSMSISLHVRLLARHYEVPVVLQTSNFHKKSVHLLEDILKLDEIYFMSHNEPMFSCHTVELSDQVDKDAITRCQTIFRKMIRFNLWLEVRLEGKSTSTEEIYDLYEALNQISPMFWISYGSEDLTIPKTIEPLRLHQVYSRQIVSSDSGSEETVKSAIRNGEVKVNLDPLAKLAYFNGLRLFYQDYNMEDDLTSSKDPEAWIRTAEKSMIEELKPFLKLMGGNQAKEEEDKEEISEENDESSSVDVDDDVDREIDDNNILLSDKVDQEAYKSNISENVQNDNKQLTLETVASISKEESTEFEMNVLETSNTEAAVSKENETDKIKDEIGHQSEVHKTDFQTSVEAQQSTETENKDLEGIQTKKELTKQNKTVKRKEKFNVHFENDQENCTSGLNDNIKETFENKRNGSETEQELCLKNNTSEYENESKEKIIRTKIEQKNKLPGHVKSKDEKNTDGEDGNKANEEDHSTFVIKLSLDNKDQDTGEFSEILEQMDIANQKEEKNKNIISRDFEEDNHNHIKFEDSASCFETKDIFENTTKVVSNKDSEPQKQNKILDVSYQQQIVKPSQQKVLEQYTQRGDASFKNSNISNKKDCSSSELVIIEEEGTKKEDHSIKIDDSHQFIRTGLWVKETPILECEERQLEESTATSLEPKSKIEATEDMPAIIENDINGNPNSLFSKEQIEHTLKMQKRPDEANKEMIDHKQPIEIFLDGEQHKLPLKEDVSEILQTDLECDVKKYLQISSQSESELKQKELSQTQRDPKENEEIPTFDLENHSITPIKESIMFTNEKVQKDDIEKIEGVRYEDSNLLEPDNEINFDETLENNEHKKCQKITHLGEPNHELKARSQRIEIPVDVVDSSIQNRDDNGLGKNEEIVLEIMPQINGENSSLDIHLCGLQESREENLHRNEVKEALVKKSADETFDNLNNIKNSDDNDISIEIPIDQTLYNPSLEEEIGPSALMEESNNTIKEDSLEIKEAQFPPKNKINIQDLQLENKILETSKEENNTLLIPGEITSEEISSNANSQLEIKQSVPIYGTETNGLDSLKLLKSHTEEISVQKEKDEVVSNKINIQSLEATTRESEYIQLDLVSTKETNFTKDNTNMMENVQENERPIKFDDISSHKPMNETIQVLETAKVDNIKIDGEIKPGIDIEQTQPAIKMSENLLENISQSNECVTINDINISLIQSETLDTKNCEPVDSLKMKHKQQEGQIGPVFAETDEKHSEDEFERNKVDKLVNVKMPIPTEITEETVLNNFNIESPTPFTDDVSKLEIKGAIIDETVLQMDVCKSEISDTIINKTVLQTDGEMKSKTATNLNETILHMDDVSKPEIIDTVVDETVQCMDDVSKPEIIDTVIDETVLHVNDVRKPEIIDTVIDETVLHMDDVSKPEIIATVSDETVSHTDDVSKPEIIDTVIDETVLHMDDVSKPEIIATVLDETVSHTDDVSKPEIIDTIIEETVSHMDDVSKPEIIDAVIDEKVLSTDDVSKPEIIDTVIDETALYTDEVSKPVEITDTVTDELVINTDDGSKSEIIDSFIIETNLNTDDVSNPEISYTAIDEIVLHTDDISKLEVTEMVIDESVAHTDFINENEVSNFAVNAPDQQDIVEEVIVAVEAPSTFKQVLISTNVIDNKLQNSENQTSEDSNHILEEIESQIESSENVVKISTEISPVKELLAQSNTDVLTGLNLAKSTKQHDAKIVIRNDQSQGPSNSFEDNLKTQIKPIMPLKTGENPKSVQKDLSQEVKKEEEQETSLKSGLSLTILEEVKNLQSISAKKEVDIENSHTSRSAPNFSSVSKYFKRDKDSNNSKDHSKRIRDLLFKPKENKTSVDNLQKASSEQSKSEHHFEATNEGSSEQQWTATVSVYSGPVFIKCLQVLKLFMDSGLKNGFFQKKCSGCKRGCLRCGHRRLSQKGMKIVQPTNSGEPNLKPKVFTFKQKKN